ncbi:MAG TPA: ABC transporter substrate-binding protein [Solirubrobacteraceae bacterium]|nr:ABC transporter substrate-binding protein [Solirubrobacteraceae bacterium]
MTHVRLMTWCPRSVSGMHLPAFAASEAGVFAEQGLEVEYVPASQAPDAVAAGDADFGLSSAVHVLAAHARAGGRLPLRFVATFHQRNPIVGVVRDDSGLRAPQDLAGARVASWGWHAVEYAGAMSRLGLGAPVLIDTPGRLDEALASGTVDVLPMWMDDTTAVRLRGMTLRHRGEDIAIRTIALDVPVYSTGLIAADRVPLDVARRMRDALTAGHELQRQRPEPGVAAFRRCFPEVAAEHARVNWELYEPYAFDGPAPGSMDAGRWRATLAHTAATHGLPTLPGEEVYRPELLTPAHAGSTAQPALHVR